MTPIREEEGWIAATVNNLTLDEGVRDIFRGILVRTIGDDAKDINFPYDRYFDPEGIGRPEKARVIGHWLCMEFRLNGPNFVEFSGLEEFLAEADLDQIWKRAHISISAEGYSEKLPSLPDDEWVIWEYENGWSMVCIERPEAIRNECHASRMQAVIGGGLASYVLKDDEKKSVAMLILRRNEIVAMFGADGKRVPYHVTESYLIDVIDDLGLVLSEPTTLHGAVQVSDGRIYDLRDIPNGSTVEGGLWIKEEGHLVSRLPDDLTVKGNFGLFGSVFIKETPKNLIVKGEMGFVDCPGLETISSGLRVSGMSYLDTCRRISEIEENVRFDGGVSLSSDIAELAAAPFDAGSLLLRGGNVSFEVEDRDIRRDDAGRVEIDGAFIQNAVKAQLRKEKSHIPGELARLVLEELKCQMRRGISGLRKKSKNSDYENEGDQSPPAPPMR